MDFNNSNLNPNGNPGGNPYGYPYRPPVRVPGSNFATAAMALGIVSIVSAFMMTIYFPFIFGSLAIVFAILSKGGAAKLLNQARAGITCAIIGLAANLVIIGGSVAIVLSNPDVLLQSARVYDEMCEQIYGRSSEELLGESMEDLVEDMIKGMK